MKNKNTHISVKNNYGNISVSSDKSSKNIYHNTPHTKKSLWKKKEFIISTLLGILGFVATLYFGFHETHKKSELPSQKIFTYYSRSLLGKKNIEITDSQKKIYSSLIQLQEEKNIVSSRTIIDNLKLNHYPKSFLFYLILAYQLILENKHTKAIIIYDKAAELEKNNFNHMYHIGLLSFALKFYEKSLIYFEKAITLNNKNSLSWFHKGYVLFLLEKYNAAIKSLNKAISLDTKNDQSWALKAMALLFANKKKEALNCINKGLIINPDSEKLKQAYDIVFNRI